MGNPRIGLVAVAGAALLAVLVILVLRAMDPDMPASPVPDPLAGAFRTPEAAPAATPLPGPRRSGPALRGIVVDGKGSPVAGAEVGAAEEGERVPSRTVTGADGRFELGIGAGEQLVGVRAAGFASTLVGGVRPGEGDLRIVLHPPVRLQGTVRESSGGPCGGALVRVALRFPGVKGNLGGFEVRTDESGHYVFQGLPPAEGTLQATFRKVCSAEVPLRLPPGSRSEERDLVVDSGLTLEGTVRARDGTPLAGIHVSGRPSSSPYAAMATTDGEGRFVLRNLKPEVHAVRATDPELRFLLLDPLPATPPLTGVRIVMDPNPKAPARATFRVEDADGKPVPSVRFVALRPGEAGARGTGSLDADGSGLFRSGTLPTGRLRIEVRAPAGSGASGEFLAESGSTVDLGTIRLAPGAAVRGRLLDAGGSPAKEARLYADEGSIPEERAVAADGSFTVRGLPPGTGRLRIRLPRRAVLLVPWAAGPGETADLGDLRFREAAGIVRGSVRSRSGASVAGVVVSLRERDDFGIGSDDRRMVVAADGRFEAAALAAGRWTLSAGRARKREGAGPEEGEFITARTSRAIDLAEGEPMEVLLEID